MVVKNLKLEFFVAECFSSLLDFSVGEEGNLLFQEIASLTGLPEPLISKELEEILQKAGVCPSSVTLDQVRQAMLVYLTEVMQLQHSS